MRKTYITPQVEEWQPVVGNAHYRISSLGRVCTDRRFLAQIRRDKKSPYLTFMVGTGKNARRRYTHREMALAFLGPPPSLNHEVRHLDGNPGNNTLGNLAWGTPQENSDDKRLHGSMARGERAGNSKLTESQVRGIRDDSRSVRVVAQAYSISLSQVRAIQQLRQWKHVT